MNKQPNWLTTQVMLLRSEFKLKFKRDELKFLAAYPAVRKLKFKPRNYILTGRTFK